MATKPTTEFEALCDKQFDLGRAEAYENLKREIAEIGNYFASRGSFMSSGRARSVVDAVLARFDLALAAFERAYLQKWGTQGSRFSELTYEWLKAKAVSKLDPEIREVGSICNSALWENSLSFVQFWQCAEIEARGRSRKIFDKIEILRLESAVTKSSPIATEAHSMVARKRSFESQRAPDLPPERALPALKRQLDSLQKLKGRNYDEAESEEQEWQHLTQSIVERAFGNPSSNLSKYHAACSAGDHFVVPFDAQIDPRVYQSNFQSRISQFESLLKSLISEVELFLPETEIKGAYEPGDEYAFYSDLKSRIQLATREIFVIDNYLDEQIFDIYVNRVPGPVATRMLTRHVSGALKTVADKFARSRAGFELRASTGVHDRILFVDDRCWAIGQSVKDAAKTKPTYIVELTSPTMRQIYEDLWNKATKV
jgi:hypothetical protein